MDTLPSGLRGVVRVVGKIRPFIDSEIAEENPSTTRCSQISLSRPNGDHPSIVFRDQAAGRKDSYKMDGCYGEEEGTSEIFSREVKPLLAGVYCGSNACVIAYGPPGSGKTHTIQGSEEHPGLAAMAIAEIFSFLEENGGCVAISCYEVYQDHVYDLLEPKEQEVLVLEDAGRKIQLKGLSMIPVKSMEDFNVLYVQGCDQRKPPQKVANNAALRSHRGLIVHVTCESSDAVVGKITFVDLAGCQDSKRGGSSDRPHLAENVKVNKSLYAMLNVVCALNCDESYVPYRESKLTRLLQDFLCRSSGAVFITCLKPTICQDTIHAVSLASRSCQAINQQRHDSAKSTKSGIRFVPPYSPLNVNKNGPLEKKENGTPSMTKRRPQPLCNSVRRSAAALYGSTETKVNDTPSMTKGRKLFNARSPMTNSVQGLTSKSLFNHKSPFTNPKQDGIPSNISTTANTSKEDDSLPLPPVAVPSMSAKDEASLLSTVVDDSSMPAKDEASLLSTVVDDLSVPAKDEVSLLSTVVDDSSMPTKDDPTCRGNTDFEQEADSEQFTDPHDNHTIEINNHNSLVSACGSSPPLSERLREISNSLKLLSAKPINISTPQVDTSCTGQSNMDVMEPKTPTLTFHSNLDDCSKSEDPISTPHDKLKARSTGLKNRLVEECLTFLNSASKEELKKLKGIGEKRADFILQLRDSRPFKDMDDVKDLGLSSKQIKEMMTRALGEF